MGAVRVVRSDSRGGGLTPQHTKGLVECQVYQRRLSNLVAAQTLRTLPLMQCAETETDCSLLAQ